MISTLQRYSRRAVITAAVRTTIGATVVIYCRVSHHLCVSGEPWGSWGLIPASFLHDLSCPPLMPPLDLQQRLSCVRVLAEPWPVLLQAHDEGIPV